MTTQDFYAAHPVGFVQALARAEHDPYAAHPWVVLAYKCAPGDYYAIRIVAGYNRYTGESISWHVPNLDDSQYDVTNAIEVTS